MTENIKSPLPRYRIAEGGSEDTGWYGIEVEDEGGEFVRFADVQRMFTRDDVDLLRAYAVRVPERAATFDSLASRIAALLPPSPNW